MRAVPDELLTDIRHWQASVRPTVTVAVFLS